MFNRIYDVMLGLTYVSVRNQLLCSYANFPHDAFRMFKTISGN